MRQPTATIHVGSMDPTGSPHSNLQNNNWLRDNPYRQPLRYPGGADPGPLRPWQGKPLDARLQVMRRQTRRLHDW